MKKNNLNIKNINIEIFKGLNENGKPIIQKLKPIQNLKKRAIKLNGLSFNTIQKSVLSIQNEKNRINNSEYFKTFDKKLIQLRENLNYKRKNYKWYYYIFKIIPNKIHVNNKINYLVKNYTNSIK